MLLSPRTAIREMTQVLGRLIGEDIELVISCSRISDIYRIERPVRACVCVSRLVCVCLQCRTEESSGSKRRTRMVLLNVSAFTVTDTGCGMSPVVFVLFFFFFFFFFLNFRGHSFDKTQGYGAGLSNVYSIIQPAGGELRRKRVGTGATFVMRLPSSPRNSWSPGDRLYCLRNGHGNERILLV